MIAIEARQAMQSLKGAHFDHHLSSLKQVYDDDTAWCEEMLEALLTVSDFSAVQFVLDLAAYKGLGGDMIDNTRRQLHKFTFETALFEGSSLAILYSEIDHLSDAVTAALNNDLVDKDVLIRAILVLRNAEASISSEQEALCEDEIQQMRELFFDAVNELDLQARTCEKRFHECSNNLDQLLAYAADLESEVDSSIFELRRLNHEEWYAQTRQYGLEIALAQCGEEMERKLAKQEAINAELTNEIEELRRAGFIERTMTKNAMTLARRQFDNKQAAMKRADDLLVVIEQERRISQDAIVEATLQSMLKDEAVDRAEGLARERDVHVHNLEDFLSNLQEERDNIMCAEGHVHDLEMQLTASSSLVASTTDRVGELEADVQELRTSLAASEQIVAALMKMPSMTTPTSEGDELSSVYKQHWRPTGRAAIH